MAVNQYLVEDAGKIVYVGNQLLDVYKNTEIIDLEEKVLMPSFVDTHMHFSSYALFASTIDVRDIEDFSDLEGKLLAYYEEKKPKLVLAFGVSAHSVKEQRLITKEELDTFNIPVPIMLIKYDGHASILNSRMLEKLPKRIRELRGYKGEVGQMYQEAYFAATDYATSQVSIIELLRNMIEGIDKLASYGIGMIHTVEGIGFPMDLDVSISKLLAKGLINPFQIRIFFQTMDTKKVHKKKLPRIGGCFETALDGCFGSIDAALNEPYLVGVDGNLDRGILFYDDDTVNAFVLKAHQDGLQIAMHAIGDRAFAQGLNAYENALRIEPRDNHRHTIIHGCLVSEESLKKAGKLGILLSVQPAFIQWPLEPLAYMKNLIGDRAERLNPLKSMLKAGIRVSGGSDAPCTVPNPIEGIYGACNHYNVEEAVSIEEALKMYTINGAYAAFDEKTTGSLEIGKYADMIIVNKNPLKIPVEELGSLSVEQLYLKGKPYKKGQTLGRLLLRGLLNGLSKNY